MATKKMKVPIYLEGKKLNPTDQGKIMIEDNYYRGDADKVRA